jgi:hypothetical protein
MWQLLLVVLCLALSSCNQNGSLSKKEQKKFRIKSDLVDSPPSKYFKDYNIFARKGVYPLTSDTLWFPFFQVYRATDTTLVLTLHKASDSEEFIIPLSNQTVYSFHDITDGPRYVYSRIEDQRIIRYGYDSDPYVSADLIRPRNIEIITQDTFYTYFSECLLNSDQYKVMPFEGQLNKDCKQVLVQYYSESLKDSGLHHYYRDISPLKYTGKQNPGDGIYGYKRIHKFWRGFFDLKD